MSKVKRILSAILAAAMISSVPAALAAEEETGMQLYVSVNGNDNADGSLSAPFATIKRAQEEVRKYNAGMSDNITVNIMGGTYYLDEPLLFNREDSGFNDKYVIYRNYKNQKVTVSGGKKITGWKIYDKAKNIWVADADVPMTRQLYVNDKRMTRAKVKDSQLIKFDSTWGEPSVYKKDGIFFADYPDVTDVEIVWRMSFAGYHMPVIGSENGDTLLMPESFANHYDGPYNPWWLASYHGVIRIENAFEFLDEKGEWYHDKREKKLYYIPQNGEDVNDDSTVLANLDACVNIKGTKGNRVQNIEFNGINFAHSSWYGPSDPEFGFPHFQSGFTSEQHPGFPNDDKFYPKAGINADFCSNIKIKNGSFRHFGGTGVFFRSASENVEITGNEFEDISLHGIAIGTPYLNYEEANELTHIDISNNYIHNIGYEFLGGDGIFCAYTQYVNITHNLIHDIGYDGISVGWGWLDNMYPYYLDDENSWKAKNANQAWRTTIANNEIYDIMAGTDDGGAIYTLGVNPHMSIMGNYIHDSFDNRTIGSVGIYLDNGSRFETVKNNIVKEVPMILYAKGCDNVISENYFDENYNSTAVIDQKRGSGEGGSVKEGEVQNNVIDNITVTDGNYPLSIMAGAGLEYEYQGLLIKGNSDENILHGKTAYTISEDGKPLKCPNGKDAAKALDENDKTYVKPITSGNWSFIADIGNSRNITDLTVSFADGAAPKKYKISYSTDGIEWSGEEYEQEGTITVNPALVARFVKVETLDGAMGIKEISAHADDFISAQEDEETVESSPFEDISDNWAKRYIDYLYANGIVYGVNKKQFAPERTVKRAEWIAMLTRAAGLQKTPYNSDYSDVDRNDWFADNIQTCREKGLIFEGFITDNLVKPYSFITRVEAARFISNLELPVTETGEIDFKDISEETYRLIKPVAENEIVSGYDGYFRPNDTLTRAEAAAMLYFTVKKIR